VVDLNPVVEEFCRNITAHIGTDIDAVLELDSTLGNCHVDRNQVVQALTFLAVNARDAMPDGGTLRIETKNIVVDPATSHKSQPGGPFIQITVSDDGVGMNPQTERHIFEPFFSTKGSEKGAGLGLATVYGIVKQSGGFIWVESQIGRGTSFKIQFPRIDVPKTTASVKNREPSVTGYETILLVDDDKSVRRIAAEVLRSAGYEVIEAKSGMEALEIAQANREAIHLLITDYSMPQMNGNATAEGVCKLHPETSVLFMSGSTREIAEAGEKNGGKIQFLGKPFSSSTLTLKVRDVLENPNVPARP
jgi:two-component system cell cycle sensor histidine kinase/response regulator CckA